LGVGTSKTLTESRPVADVKKRGGIGRGEKERQSTNLLQNWALVSWLNPG